MLYKKTVKNYWQILDIIDNMTPICNITSLKVNGKRNDVYIEFNYEIKERPISNLMHKYNTALRIKIEQLFDTFINEKDNMLFININKFYKVLIGLKKDEYIIEWIETYFCYDNDVLKIFNELHQ